MTVAVAIPSAVAQFHAQVVPALRQLQKHLDVLEAVSPNPFARLKSPEPFCLKRRPKEWPEDWVYEGTHLGVDASSPASFSQLMRGESTRARLSLFVADLINLAYPSQFIMATQEQELPTEDVARYVPSIDMVKLVLEKAAIQLSGYAERIKRSAPMKSAHARLANLIIANKLLPKLQNVIAPFLAVAADYIRQAHQRWLDNRLPVRFAKTFGSFVGAAKKAIAPAGVGKPKGK